MTQAPHRSWLSSLQLFLSAIDALPLIPRIKLCIATLASLGQHSFLLVHSTQNCPCRDRRTGNSPYPRVPICTLPARPHSGNLLGSRSAYHLYDPAAQLSRVSQLLLRTRGAQRVKYPSTVCPRRGHRSRRPNGGTCVCSGA